MSRPERFFARLNGIRPLAVAMLILAGGVLTPAETAAQEAEPIEQLDMVVRVTARLRAGGEIEFGLQQRRPDGSWSERLLPELRIVGAEPRVGRWLQSSSLAVGGDVTSGSEPPAHVELRVVARRLDGGRTEMAIQQRHVDDRWGERLLPAQRFFPAVAEVGRWLVSRPVTVTALPFWDRFVAVAAGDRHACGLGVDRTVSCWGNGHDGEADPPGGQFASIAAGYRRSCGIRTDGTAVCWGLNRHGQSDVPDGRFTALTVSREYSCGLRPGGNIDCWGEGATKRPIPTGRFTAIAGGPSHSCAVRSDGAVVCWGHDDRGLTDVHEVPGGAFTAVTAGASHSCGLRTDGTVRCWGRGSAAEDAPSRERFDSVDSGLFHTCGLGTDGSATCWGIEDGGRTRAPGGPLSHTSAGASFSCGVRLSGAVVCWGADIVQAPASVRFVRP